VTPPAWQSRRVRSALVAAVTAATVLALAAPAAATIVPQQGIAGVRLHMTKAQVRAKLGAPKRALNGRNEFGLYSTWVYARVTISFQGQKRVTSMKTLSRLERTATGVGVGSPEARVKARAPAAKCRTESGSRQCVVGAFGPGRTVTVFSIKSGKVRAVLVGIVID